MESGEAPQRPQRPQRPATAPGRQFSVRRHQQLLQQLRITIAETEAPPPAGFDRVLIARRRDALRRILHDVERQGARARLGVARAFAERYANADAAQRAREEKTLERALEREQHGAQHAEEFHDEVLRFWRGRNAAADRRTAKSVAHLAATEASRITRAATEGERRDEQLERLSQRRERERSERQVRQAEAEARCAEMLRRKETRDAEHRAQLEEMAAANRRKAQDVQAARDAARAEAAARRKARAEQAHSRGAVGKVEVSLRPMIEMRVAEVPHAERMRQLWLREQRQHAAYASGEGAELQEAASERRARREAKLRRQQENQEQLTNQRLQRGAEILEAVEQRRRHVAAMRRLRDEYYAQQSAKKRDEFVAHLRAAQLRLQARIDRGRRATYTRWNRRADAIMEGVVEQYAEFLTELEGGPSPASRSATPEGGREPAPDGGGAAPCGDASRAASPRRTNDDAGAAAKSLGRHATVGQMRRGAQ